MALDEDFGSLTRNPLLAALDAETLRQVVRGGAPRTLRAGEILFRRDDASESGFLLRSGSIALQPASEEAAPRVVFPPALIGEMALMAPTRRPVTATVREQAVVLEISRADFQRALAQSPTSAERVRRLVASRLRGFSGALEGLRGHLLDEQEES